MNPKQVLKPRSSRRKFLKSSALATAPFILPSHIWAAKTKPNDKLVMGFIGMGKQNGGLLRNFMGQGIQAVAVCDVDTNRRKNAQNIVNNHNKNSDCRAVIDFREITEDKGIDAVCIATPDHWHSVITISALNNKKDVYCEKPLTHNIKEARLLTNLAREKKVVSP